jgi:hypothetical protein
VAGILDIVALPDAYKTRGDSPCMLNERSCFCDAVVCFFDLVFWGEHAL